MLLVRDVLVRPSPDRLAFYLYRGLYHSGARGLIGRLTRRFGEMPIVITGVAVLAFGQFFSAFIRRSNDNTMIFAAVILSTSLVCIGFA